MKLLLVEDVAHDAEILLRHLKRSGLECEWRRVESETAFLSAIREFRPDLILSDFSLPQFDGLAALELVRQLAPETPFIFVSGTIGEERAIEALKCGAVDYVLKTNLARLGPAVRRALEESASRKARLEAEGRLGRLARVLQMLSGINTAAIRIRDREALLAEACRIAEQVGGYTVASVSLVVPGTRTARVVAWAGVEVERLRHASFALAETEEGDTSLTSRVVRTGQPVVIHELSHAEIPPGVVRNELGAVGIRSGAALPLLVDGTPVGVFLLVSREARVVGEEELQLLLELSANLSYALQHLHQEDRVEFLSYYDPLTGLAKRALFCDRIGRPLLQQVAPTPAIIVGVFDIERLSAINESFGRHIGDVLLQNVAERLNRHFEAAEQLAHLGNGVFALAAPKHGSASDSLRLLQEQLSAIFEGPFVLEGRRVRVNVRSGFATWPENGRDAATLLQNAEAALRRAKESGEQYLHHRLEMNSEVVERLAMEQRLRVALEENQFVLHYQPQVSLRTGRIESVEALLRWNDPERGLVSPAAFIPILEATGLVVPVGDWVVKQAVADLRRWRETGFPPTRVAVNVSPQQLRRRAFVEQLLHSAYAAAPAGGLEIEITEGALLDDSADATAKLKALRAAGVRIAIDDFGTGYSSLSRMSQLPVDTLKIDRSFVSQLPEDPASCTLVETIISLARAFGLSTVAEGVETEPQREHLARMGCDFSQGYLHGRPVPADRLQTPPATAAGRP